MLTGTRWNARCRAAGCVLAAALALTVTTLRAQSPHDLFQKALAVERADGDLRGAVALYAKVVEQAGSDRALAARALVRIGECRQKLGDPEVALVWETIVSKYADQRESLAVARAHLDQDRKTRRTQSAGSVTRRIATASSPGLNVQSSVSPDGRYLPLVDWAGGGNLVVRDLVTGRDRRVTDTGTFGTNAKEQFAKDSSFSRDGTQLAFSWRNGEHYELRVIPLQGTGVPRVRRLFVQSDVDWVTPHDWTPDGTSILVSVSRLDGRTEIGLVRVADGTLKVLKAAGERLWITRMFVSPDGRHAALDQRANDREQQRDVFVLALDGSGEWPAVVSAANEVAMGWSPDGRSLLVASDRNTGVPALFAVPYAGAATAMQQPVLLKSGMEGSYPLGITRTGSLFFASMDTVESYFDLRLATVNLDTGQTLSEPVSIPTDPRASNESPAWSPDGQFLAYVATRPAMSGVRNAALAIFDLAAGKTREMVLPLRYFAAPRWSPDGRSLLVGGTDLRGQAGIYRVDVALGQTLTLLTSDTPTPWAAWSSDGTSVYYKKVVGGGKQAAFVARDLASGHERELVRRVDLGEINVSPDGRYIATTTRDNGITPVYASAAAVLLIPTSGGEPRELLRAAAVSNGPEWLNSAVAMMAWAPDSASVLVYKYAAQPVPTMEVWRTALDGAMRRLDWTLRLRGQPSVHPDGRRIAYQERSAATREAAVQVWALDNFLPALTRP